MFISFPLFVCVTLSVKAASAVFDHETSALSQTYRFVFLCLCSHDRPRRSSHVENLPPPSSSLSSPSATSTNHLRGGGVLASGGRASGIQLTSQDSIDPVRHRLKNKLLSLTGWSLWSLKKKIKRTFWTAVLSGCFQLSVIILMLSSVFGEGWGLLV